MYIARSLRSLAVGSARPVSKVLYEYKCEFKFLLKFEFKFIFEN